MSNVECITRSILARFIDRNYRPVIHGAHICAFARFVEAKKVGEEKKKSF
jgi:hypothetical protein